MESQETPYSVQFGRITLLTLIGTGVLYLAPPMVKAFGIGAISGLAASAALGIATIDMEKIKSLTWGLWLKVSKMGEVLMLIPRKGNQEKLP